ncbi:MAG: hypothetical protein M3Q69_12440 [Acidobacteriota bacterium]|nr:hypothetical protein [Acidobacteriota bacterium]
MMRPYQLPKCMFDSIDPRWHTDLFKFLDSGDASDEFLVFLDRDEQAQRLVEAAFAYVSQDVAATARGLKADITPALQDGDSQTNTFARLFTHMLLALTALDDVQRGRILKLVETWLPPREQQQVASEIARTLGSTESNWWAGDDKHAS